jgi:hypothetical protein
MLTYKSIDEAIAKIRISLEQPAFRQSIAHRGLTLLQNAYSKREQWCNFGALVSELS